jgi:hypothetical protein
MQDGGLGRLGHWLAAVSFAAGPFQLLFDATDSKFNGIEPALHEALV